MSFGENLKKLRKEHNLSQEALAEKLDVSRQAVSKWESDAGFPEVDKLILIAKIFNASLDKMLRTELGRKPSMQEIIDEGWTKAIKAQKEYEQKLFQKAFLEDNPKT